MRLSIQSQGEFWETFPLKQFSVSCTTLDQDVHEDNRYAMGRREKFDARYLARKVKCMCSERHPSATKHIFDDSSFAMSVCTEGRLDGLLPQLPEECAADRKSVV